MWTGYSELTTLPSSAMSADTMKLPSSSLVITIRKNNKFPRLDLRRRLVRSTHNTKRQPRLRWRCSRFPVLHSSLGPLWGRSLGQLCQLQALPFCVGLANPQRKRTRKERRKRSWQRPSLCLRKATRRINGLGKSDSRKSA